MKEEVENDEPQVLWLWHSISPQIRQGTVLCLVWEPHDTRFWKKRKTYSWILAVTLKNNNKYSNQFRVNGLNNPPISQESFQKLYLPFPSRHMGYRTCISNLPPPWTLSRSEILRRVSRFTVFSIFWFHSASFLSPIFHSSLFLSFFFSVWRISSP